VDGHSQLSLRMQEEASVGPLKEVRLLESKNRNATSSKTKIASVEPAYLDASKCNRAKT